MKSLNNENETPEPGSPEAIVQNIDYVISNSGHPGQSPTVPPVEDDKLVRTNGYFNRTALRRQALRVSAEARQGKFSRVSTEFLEIIEANIEAKIRAMKADVGNSPYGQVDPAPGEEYLTGAGKKKLFEAFNLWIARETHRQINLIRTGKTL